jgi:hypothetical protein
MRLEHAIRVDQQPEAFLAVGYEKTVPAIAMSIEHFDRTLVTLGIVEHLCRGIGKRHPDAPKCRLLQDERRPGQRVIASFELRLVNGAGTFGSLLPVPLVCGGPLLLSSHPDQRLPEDIMCRRVVGREANQFLKQGNGSVELA